MPSAGHNVIPKIGPPAQLAWARPKLPTRWRLRLRARLRCLAFAEPFLWTTRIPRSPLSTAI